MQRTPLIIIVFVILIGVAAPGRARTQTPTPVPASPLMSLLDLLPDSLPSDGQIRYADYALQLDAVGVEGSGADIDTAVWLEAVHGMMLPMTFMVPIAPDWREGLGFDLRDIDALVELRGSDTSITVMQGQFDTTPLPTVWESAGYSPVEGDGVTWYTLGEDHALIFEHPMHSMHLGSLSHLVALDDGVVVGTATRADMEAVIALAGGDGSSFADGRGALFEQAPDDLAAAYIVDGSTLIGTPDPLAAMIGNPNVSADVQEALATQSAQQIEEAPRMPPIYTALLGVSAGAANADQAASGAPQSRSLLMLVPLDEAATELIAETVTRRLTSQTVTSHSDFVGQPYSALFEDMVIETSPEHPVVVVELTPVADVPSTILITTFQARQLTILMWAP